jgi:hypothetical protein
VGLARDRDRRNATEVAGMARSYGMAISQLILAQNNFLSISLRRSFCKRHGYLPIIFEAVRIGKKWSGCMQIKCQGFGLRQYAAAVWLLFVVERADS